MKEKTPPKKEMTPEEAVQAQMDMVAEACENIMKVSERTKCPPEAVATVVMMRGLQSELHLQAEVLAGGNQNLLNILAGLFGKQRKVVIPEPGSLRVH